MGSSHPHSLFAIWGGGAVGGSGMLGFPDAVGPREVCLSPPQDKEQHLLGLGVMVPGPGNIEYVWGVCVMYSFLCVSMLDEC